jgi:hypothetical protein
MMRGKNHARLLLIVVLVFSSQMFAQRSFNFEFSKTLFEVTVSDGEVAVSDHELQTYIEHGATSVKTYFGRFPANHLNLRIRSVKGDRVRFGRSSPTAGGTIMLLIGRDAKADALDSDWTLTHEMVHLAFPATKGDNHDWLGEGMATYVEPIARAQAGYLSQGELWRQFVEYMPRALPQPGDGGLDGSRGIGRIYWGGALFCLLADLEIRKQTHNRKGLQDAFRRIMAEDGTMQWEWDINEIFATGDRATGTKVLSTLYREWRDKPVTVNLEKLWQQLGIERKGSSVVFNDQAPIAAIRRAIGKKSPR